MKKIVKLIFKIHRFIFRVPSKANVRIALEQKQYMYDLSWRVGMLYVCGESITVISEWVSMEESEIVKILNKLADEVVYE